MGRYGLLMYWIVMIFLLRSDNTINRYVGSVLSDPDGRSEVTGVFKKILCHEDAHICSMPECYLLIMCIFRNICLSVV